MTRRRTFRPRKHIGFEPGVIRIADRRSSDKYGSGRNGVWAPEFDPKLIDKWKRQGWRYERQPKIGLIYPDVNGFNDPLSVALVVDLVMRLEPNKYIPSSVLVSLLSEQFPHILWDAVTVGRIMKALVEEAADRRAPGGAEPPLTEIRFSDGRVFLIHANPGNHYWLAQVREYFGTLAEQYVAAAHKGEKLDRSGQIWADVTTLPWGVAPGRTPG